MEGIRPAALSFLAIYNPALGQTDETLHEQVVYYHSSKLSKAPASPSEDAEKREREDKNERLRQIGLAQGMVEFAKAFSDGAPVDAIDAEKSRILLRELEPGWWMLASIDLTRLRHDPKASKSKTIGQEGPAVEYSSREVSPQELLLQQLLRAHSIFLLHQAPSLSDLWIRLTRPRFCGALEKFWNRFIREWDVLLHGSPGVDIFNGVKLAAGGELGIGVGEEEWGSGEREVLEGFVGRTEGLLDVVVSKFGTSDETPIEVPKSQSQNTQPPWLGSGSAPTSLDGVIFSGTGAITRACLRTVSAWTEWIYTYGPNAYGVRDSPRRRRRKKRPTPPSKPRSESRTEAVSQKPALPPGIPPPIARVVDRSLESATKKAESEGGQSSEGPSASDTMLKYMTLGIYGSSWSASGNKRDDPGEEVARTGQSHTTLNETFRYLDPRPEGLQSGPDVRNGCFLIGLQGSLEDDTPATDSDEPFSADAPSDASNKSNLNPRILVRPLYIELDYPSTSPTGSPPPIPAPPPTHHARLRVVIYVRRPFIFTFLFQKDTPTLSYTAFYRSLHHQLGPLQRPLLRSTSPEIVQSRMADAVSSPRTLSPLADNTSENPIFDLLWDPRSMTVHSTLPGIPEPGTLAAEGLGTNSSEWTRMDAINVHTQILSLVQDTRQRPGDLERTVKTSRGWWVVWIRLPPEKDERFDRSSPEKDQKEDEAEESGQAKAEDLGSDYREAILVRRANGYARMAHGKKGWKGSSSNEGGWAGAGRVVGGIGIDARRYVEGLLSLNR